MPCEALLKSSDLFCVTHLPCSKAISTEAKLKPRSYCSCMRSLQNGCYLTCCQSMLVCCFPPISVAGDTGNAQHFNTQDTLDSALYLPVQEKNVFYHTVIRWLKHFTTWSQLNILGQQLTDVTEMVFVHFEVRICFPTDLRTIFRPLVSRITRVCWETKVAEGPHPGIGNSKHLCPAQCICSKKLENIWNLVITCSLWPFSVLNNINLLYGMFLGSFKGLRTALLPEWRHPDNPSPNNGWVIIEAESGTF